MPMVLASPLRLVTRPTGFLQPTPATDALAFVDAIAAAPGVRSAGSKPGGWYRRQSFASLRTPSGVRSAGSKPGGWYRRQSFASLRTPSGVRSAGSVFRPAC
jgi:hypothetical protein